MNKVKWTRLLGVIGATASAALLFMNGQIIEAVGVLTAAFGSASVVATK